MFSMFRSQASTPKLNVTIEDTEKFLKKMMRLITESKGLEGPIKQCETEDETMLTLADRIKWSLNKKNTDPAICLLSTQIT